MVNSSESNYDLITSVYSYIDPVPADLYGELDADRLILLERSYSNSGKDYLRELFDLDSGEIIHTTENKYDKFGLLISVVEKSTDGESMVMERKYSYSESGKITRESEYCDGELQEETEYVYDSADRLIRKTHSSEELTITKDYKYRGNSDNIVKITEYSDFGVDSETDKTYGEINGVFELLETNYVNKHDSNLSRRSTFNPENGSNGKIYETEWSAGGRMISTSRHLVEETEKGKTTTIEVCVDEDLNSVPFERTIYIEDLNGNEVYSEHRNNGVLTMMTSSVFDENKRKSREYHNSGNEHILTVYKYEQR